jgi:hypothetical protein
MNILTAKEISICLKKSLKFVYSNAAKLGGIKIGGSWIFTQEGFENALQRGKQLAGQSDIQRSKIHKSAQDKKGRYRLGTLKAKGTQEERETLAARAGLADFL